MILVIGGCGFLGSNFIRYWLANNDEKVINFDPLFTGKAKTLIDLETNPNYELIDVSIEDPSATRVAMNLRPRAIINFASSEEFLLPSNILSVYRLLMENGKPSRGLWNRRYAEYNLCISQLPVTYKARR